MGIIGEFTIGDGTIIGEGVPPGHPIDTQQRIFSGPSPWLDDTPEDDTAAVERSVCTRVFAIDENWNTLEEIIGITDDSCRRSARLWEKFCHEEDFVFKLEDPDGLYSPGGDKYDWLKPRALIRVVKRVWNDYGTFEQSIMVYRISTIPGPTDDGSGYSAEYHAVDWAREFLDTKMPTTMYQIAYWVWMAQGYTSHETADLFAQLIPPGGPFSETQPGLFPIGDRLFRGVPLPDYSGYPFPPDERPDLEAADWRYTLIGYLWLNMMYLTGRRFTVDGRFRDVGGLIAFGKPVIAASFGAAQATEPSPVPFGTRGARYPVRRLPRRSVALRGNRSLSTFGPLDASIPADLGTDPVDRWNFGQFWGSAEEWPTYKQFLASMFATDFATRTADGFIRYGVYPAILVYDNEGHLHLRATDDLGYRGIGFSCDAPRGQIVQLPIEELTRTPRLEGPEYNRVVIQRLEPKWDAPWESNPDDEFNPLEGTEPGGIPVASEVITYADEKVNTRWYQYDEATDRTFNAGLNQPWYMIPWRNWQSEQEMMDHRAGLTAIAISQARALLNKYVSEADTARIILTSAFNLCTLGDVVLLYYPPTISGFYKIVSIEQPQNADPQSWNLQWVADV